jgi:hypothetical protein
VNGNRPALTGVRVAELLELMPDPESRRLLQAYYRAIRAGLAGGFAEAPERVAPTAVRTAMSFYEIGRPRSREELRVTGRHLELCRQTHLP